jgi:hypothetical protein
MPFVNTVSFSHRFSDEAVTSDCCSYQEINHIYSGDNALALSRAFYQFMMACGYAPQSVSDAMQSIGAEYGEAYCYDKQKSGNNGTSNCGRGAV